MMSSIKLITPVVNGFTFYDTETSGTNKSYDQVYQYASVKTNSDLEIDRAGIKNLLCKPRLDVVPHPMAFLTHHIDVDQLIKSGVNEFTFSRQIHNDLMEIAGTAISGYNTNKFDNEMLRALFYRNMKPIYEHESKKGNFNFDVYKLVQLAYALRPGVLNWPKNEEGRDSLKLALLSKENGIVHENAHEALSDVFATIGIAKIIKEANPKLFEYSLQMCAKKNVESLISARVPLIHVDIMKGKEFRMMSLVYPVVMDMSNKNNYHMLDLRDDPRAMMDMNPQDINRYIFTKRSELPEGSPTMPLCTVSINKQPIVVEAEKMLTNSVLDDAQLDYDQCMRNLEYLRKNTNVARKIQDAFRSDFSVSAHDDVYKKIYGGGFFSSFDENSRSETHLCVPGEGNTLAIENLNVHEVSMRSHDPVRVFDLNLRAKWNSFYESLLIKDFSPNELSDWVQFLENRLFGESEDGVFKISDYHKEISRIQLEMPLNEHDAEVINNLTKYVQNIEMQVSSLRELSDSLSASALSEISSNKSINGVKARINIIIDSYDKRKDSVGTREPSPLSM